MKIDQIISGLMVLLKENNYNRKTIKFYMVQWHHLKDFMQERYDNDLCLTLYPRKIRMQRVD